MPMNHEKADVLVITPHPDDAEFGAAGTVVNLIREGKTVVYVVCTDGSKGTDNPKADPKELIGVREKEQQDAAKILGVSEVKFLRYEDQNIEDTPGFRKDIVRQIRAFRPELVITSDPHRRYVWHRDHRIVGRVVLDAVFPYARDVWAYPDLMEEGLGPHKVKEVWLWAPEDRDINFRSNITETYQIKLNALHCHRSQIRRSFVEEMEKWLCSRAREMAKGEDFKLAEGFHRVEIFW